jgi:hypothetical protein
MRHVATFPAKISQALMANIGSSPVSLSVIGSPFVVWLPWFVASMEFEAATLSIVMATGLSRKQVIGRFRFPGRDFVGWKDVRNSIGVFGAVQAQLS